MRKILGPKREKVAGGWRRLHNEEFYNFYATSNIIRMIKFGRIRCTGTIAHIGDIINSYKMLVGNLKGRDRSKDLGVNGVMILEWILDKRDGKF
jgi:hypothetical protein